MDKLIKVEARKEFSDGKYVLRERCDLQFAGEICAKYVSESAVSVAGQRRRQREEKFSHMIPCVTSKSMKKSPVADNFQYGRGVLVQTLYQKWVCTEPLNSVK